MKKQFTLIAALLIVLTTFAQQGINYKAILKDTNGNLLAGTFMNVQFSIHEISAAGAIVYQEDHNYTTDANGLVILNIGSDTSPSIGVFNDIDWGSDQHFLQTTITYSGGTINFDATEFMAVPYALSAANVTGLEKITEETSPGSGEFNSGWRLVGVNPDNYEPIGNNAVDLSYQNHPEFPFGASGTRSFATGFNTGASGTNSVAMGTVNFAQEHSSVSLGSNNYSYGFASISLGLNTKAKSVGEVTMGMNNTNYTVDNTNGPGEEFWNPLDRIFVVGNGESPSITSNALMILKNGTITAPSFDLAEITDAKALITKEYLIANTVYNLNGLNDANVDGDGRSIFIGKDSGEFDDETNNDNVALGFKALAINTTGSFNTSIGFETLHLNETGNFNTAVGNSALSSNTTALSNTAIGASALKDNTEGNGNSAVGSSTLRNNLTGDHNTAIGSKALLLNTTGQRNTASGFDALYNNNGNQNTANGQEALYANTTGYNNTASGYQALNANTTGFNNTAIGYDAQVSSPTSSNQVRIGNTAINYAGIQVGWTVTSDKRWKDNIRELPYGLDLVMQMQPVDYTRKNNDKQTREMGFIAQNVEVLLAKVGYTDQGFLTKDDKGYISLRYNDLIALLTKAIQEQQDIIDGQKTQIKKLATDNMSLTDTVSDLISRVEKIEANNQ
ncbi:MAG: hypothetical protein EX254_03975 [Flavobacteriaceae bacterium]|nr:MAG: hypothetical protein EX254_03975 [Flavobacteriaceae bacterium]